MRRHIPRWSLIRGFGQISYFNISYAVLLLVPLMVDVYHRAPPWITAIPFPASLLWIYSASFLYAIAIVVYQFLCPRVVRSFTGAEEYVRDKYEIFARSSPQHKLSIVLTHLKPDIDSQQYGAICTAITRRSKTLGAERLSVDKELETLTDALHPDAVQRFLTTSYERADTSYPFVRAVTFVLYAAATGILIWLFVARGFRVMLLALE